MKTLNFNYILQLYIKPANNVFFKEMRFPRGNYTVCQRVQKSENISQHPLIIKFNNVIFQNIG